eukprot:scaffold8246_cov127-Skeletonema_marinoi.AAC.4
MPAPAPGTHNQRRHLNSDEILATCVLVFLVHEAQVHDIPRRQRGVSTSPGNLRTMGLRRNPWSNAP